MFSKFFGALRAAKDEFSSVRSEFGDGSFATVSSYEEKPLPTGFPYVDEYLLPEEKVIESISCMWLNKPRASNVPSPDVIYATQHRLLYWDNFRNPSEFRFVDIDYFSFEERSPTKQTNKEFQLWLSQGKGKSLLLAGYEQPMKEFFSCVEPLLANAINLKK